METEKEKEQPTNDNNDENNDDTKIEPTVEGAPEETTKEAENDDIKEEVGEIIEEAGNIDGEGDKTLEKSEAEKEEEDDNFSLISTEDTEEQEEQYKEYLAVLKEIKAKNQAISDYKKDYKELRDKKFKSKSDCQEISVLEQCLRIEKGNLEDLVTKAIKLQNYGSKRRYGFIPIETMPDEE